MTLLREVNKQRKFICMFSLLYYLSYGYCCTVTLTLLREVNKQRKFICMFSLLYYLSYDYCCTVTLTLLREVNKQRKFTCRFLCYSISARITVVQLPWFYYEKSINSVNSLAGFSVLLSQLWLLLYSYLDSIKRTLPRHRQLVHVSFAANLVDRAKFLNTILHNAMPLTTIKLN